MNNTEIATQKRIQFIDVARGIGIISIMLGHFGIFSIVRVLYTYSIPLFYLITGYFFDENASALQFTKRKARTLLVPYALTSVVIILLGTLIGLFKNDFQTPLKIWTYAAFYGSGSTWAEPYYIKGIGPIWFFLATFIGCVILRSLQKNSLSFRLIVILSAFVFGCLTSKYLWLPFSIQSGLCSVLFIYLGYVFRKKKHLFVQMNRSLKVSCLIIAAIIWALFIWRFESFWIVNCDFGNGVLDICSSVCACISVFAISFFIDRYIKILAGFLSYIGKNSMYILCVHTIDIDLFQRAIFYPLVSRLNENTRVLVLCLGELILAIALGLALSKIKAIRKAFGERG